MNSAVARAIAPASFLVATTATACVTWRVSTTHCHVNASYDDPLLASSSAPTVPTKPCNTHISATSQNECIPSLSNQYCRTKGTILATSALEGSGRSMTTNNKHSSNSYKSVSDTKVVDGRSKLIFLGTGSSTGCPKPLCTMLFASEGVSSNRVPLDGVDEYRQTMERRCKVSNQAIRGDPRTNKNYRNNPSVLIHHYSRPRRTSAMTTADPPTPKNVIFDVGKTFREGALRWFPVFGIESLDAIILTHHHMDAAAGLDDVRGFQRTTPSRDQQVNAASPSPPPNRVSIPLYMSQFCYDDLSDRFPWLLPRKAKVYHGGQTNDPKVAVKRDVASFDVQVVSNYESFSPAEGLTITPLPVWHGDDLISLGFGITIVNDSDSEKKSTHIVYLSDISRMVPETMEYIQKKLPPTDILIVDSLLWHQPHPVHYSLDQAMELKDEIRPRQGTYLIGMSCDDFLDHDSMNRHLKEKFPGENVQFAHDGLSIEL